MRRKKSNPNMSFKNVYEDATRAEAYAKLELPNTYYLAYRDLPDILSEHVQGTKALDFGCGTGRSTRFLRQLGFTVTGVDIAEDMIERARAADPHGNYRLIDEADLSLFGDRSLDLVLAAFTFDNIPTMDKKSQILTEIGRVLKDSGKAINLVSSPEIYLHEWASFSTKDFPENRLAKSGERVRIIMKDVGDQRPVEDVVWSDEDYRVVFKRAGMELVQRAEPLGKEDEPYQWINEERIPPWIIYILEPKSDSV